MQQNAIWAQLQSVDYSEAIDRYNYLKMRFFNEYSAVANIEESLLIEQVENDIAEDINNNPIGKQYALAEELYKWVQEMIAAKLEGKAESDARKKIKALYKESKQKGIQAANELGNQLLSEEELALYVKTQLAARGVGTGFSIEDILNQVRSYRNKIILFRTNASTARYITSTKGYYREALVYKVFGALGEHIGALPVISAGAIKDIKGKDTLYDTYISFFNNVGKSFSQLINENIDVGYGIQSKSWTAPWEGDVGYFNSKYGFSIGNRSDLLQNSGLKGTTGVFNWIKGVLYLEKYAVQAIGENQLGFVTGNNFYWTADLIAYFRALNYFLAFGYAGQKSLSSTVKWQTIPLDKT